MFSYEGILQTNVYYIYICKKKRASEQNAFECTLNFVILYKINERTNMVLISVNQRHPVSERKAKSPANEMGGGEAITRKWGRKEDGGEGKKEKM